MSARHLWIWIVILAGASCFAAEVKTIRPAKGELLKDGKVIGSLISPANTTLDAAPGPDGALLVNYLGGKVKIARVDTNLPAPPQTPAPDFVRLETKSGTFTDVYIVDRNAAEITIRHADGVSTVRIDRLDKALQKEFGYDPAKAAVAIEEQRERSARFVEANKLAKAKTPTPAPAQPKAIPVPPPPQATPGAELDDKTWNGLVAVAPTRLYALKIDPAMLANPKSGEYGKDGQPGDPIAEVPAGFYVVAARYNDPVGGTVELDVPIGPHRHAYVYRADFAHIGAPGWRKWWDDQRVSMQMVPDDLRFEPATLKPETAVYDLFAKDSLILSNHQGGIQQAFATRQRSPTDPVFGLAKTSSGWFFGFVREKSVRPAPPLAWAEVVKSNDTAWRLNREKIVEVIKGSALFKLADLDSLRRDLTPRTNPSEARLLPEHYGLLLRFGLSGVLGELNTNTAGVVKLLTPTPGALAPAEKQVLIKEFGLKFLTWSPERTLLEINLKQDEREIERRITAGKMTTDMKPWKTNKITAERWIDNDPDGGLRLTDGKQIYEIARNTFGKTEFRTYSIAANPLAITQEAIR